MKTGVFFWSQVSLAVLGISTAAIASSGDRPGLYRPLCSGLNLRSVPEGTTCLTSKTKAFRLLKRDTRGAEEWEDVSAKVTWGDRLGGQDPHAHDKLLAFKRYQLLGAGALQEIEKIYKELQLMGYVSHDQAAALCRLVGDDFALPTETDFRLSDSHGFTEVLPNLAGSKYRTSTMRPLICINPYLTKKECMETAPNPTTIAWDDKSPGHIDLFEWTELLTSVRCIKHHHDWKRDDRFGAIEDEHKKSSGSWSPVD